MSDSWTTGYLLQQKDQEIAALRARLALLEAVADAARFVLQEYDNPNYEVGRLEERVDDRLRDALSSVPQ